MFAKHWRRTARSASAYAISGHATEQMQQHYSTVNQTEMRQGMAKVIPLAGVREAMGAGGMENRAGGMEVVRIDATNENGQSTPQTKTASWGPIPNWPTPHSSRLVWLGGR